MTICKEGPFKSLMTSPKNTADNATIDVITTTLIIPVLNNLISIIKICRTWFSLQKHISIRNPHQNDLASLSDKINDIEKQVQLKEKELNNEISKNKEILEQKNNLSNILKEKKDEIIILEVENDNLNDKLELKNKELNEYKQKYKNKIKKKDKLLTN